MHLLSTYYLPGTVKYTGIKKINDSFYSLGLSLRPGEEDGSIEDKSQLSVIGTKIQLYIKCYENPQKNVSNPNVE